MNNPQPSQRRAVLFLAILVAYVLALFPVASAPVARAQTANSPDLLALHDDSLLTNALYLWPERLASNFAATGAVSVNIAYENGQASQWFIEQQRYGGDFIQAGIFTNNDALIREGLLLLDWGFDRQGSDGSFPLTGDPFHSTSMFVEGAARGLLLLQQSGRPGYNDTIQAMLPKLEAAARWMMVPSVASRGQSNNRPYTHRRYIVASALAITAELTGDADIAAAATPYIQDALSLQQPDGVNPEKGGGDVNYQALGLLMAARYLTVCSDAVLCQAVRTMIERGLQWELAKIDAEGNVSAVCSTRTEVERGRSGSLKTINYKEIVPALSAVYNTLGTPSAQTASQLIAIKRNWVTSELATVAGVSATTFEDSAAGWIWNGWNTITNSNASGGSLRGGAQLGASGTYRFTGTGVEVYTAKGPGNGTIEILINGVSQGLYSLDNPVDAFQQLVFAFKGLPNVEHTLQIVARDANPVAIDSIVASTALPPVAGPPVEWYTLDNIVSGWTYSGWTQTADSAANCGAYHGGTTAGANGQFNVIGTDIQVFTTKRPDGGTVEIFINNVSQGRYSLFASETAYKQQIFSISGLPNTLHTLRIVAVDTGWTGVDYLTYRLPIGVPVIVAPVAPVIPTQQLVAVEDTYGRDGSNANTNFGSETAVIVKNDVLGNNRESYLKFNLASFAGTVLTATVRLYPRVVNPGTGIIHAAGVLPNDTWSESTLTWNNRPTNSVEIASWTPVAQTFINFDVTSYVREALATDKLLSLRLFAKTFGTDQGANYASREHGTASQRPTLVIEITAPTTIATVTPAPGAAGWYTSDVSIGLNAAGNTDGSGIKEIGYSASGAQQIGATTVMDSAVATLPLISQNGETTISYFARDRFGNTESPKTLTIRLDKAAPAVAFSANGVAVSDGAVIDNATPLAFDFTASDAHSGLASTAFYLDGQPYQPGTAISYAGASSIRTLRVVASDVVGNQTDRTITLNLKNRSELLPIRPVLECVTNNSNGTYTAHFGYRNDNAFPVIVVVGNNNRFSPSPQARGQTETFLPGRHMRQFSVEFPGSNLVWTLSGRTSTASSSSTLCR
jgi:hypothetical protein